MTRILAHRGSSKKAPENTMAAFRLALEEGADGLETDLHMTADGEIILCHDEMLGRTVKGEGWIGSFTRQELKEKDCGSWFHSRFIQERVPALDDLLDLTEGSSTILNLEIKGGNELYPGLEQKVLQTLQNRNWKSPLMLSSFNHLSLKRLAALGCPYPLGILTASLMDRPWEYAAALGAQAYHPHYFSLIPEHLLELKKAGLQVNPYTVDNPEDMIRLFKAGVDHLITNLPELALKTRDSL